VIGKLLSKVLLGIFQIWVNPAQTGGMKNLKQRRYPLLLQTMRILIIPQKHVSAGVLYLKHQNLDWRIRKIENYVADSYQLCQDRKEAEVRFISWKSVAFMVSCVSYVCKK